MPGSYSQESGGALPAEELAAWWAQLDDPVLDRIMAEALTANFDLAQSTARLRQARESLVQARAQLLPTVTASGGVGQTVDPDGEDRTSFSLDGDASWEADLFGGTARSIEASRADAEAAGFDLAAVRVAVAGEVATNYVQARLAQARLEVARDTLVIADENLEIAGWRREAGLVSSLDVEQARSQRAQTAATLPDLERSFRNAVHRLGVLAGRPPADLLALLSEPEPVPRPPAILAVGIPADTLRQRPDVRSAERSLAAATARIGVAEAQLRPALRLTGNLGSTAFSLGNIVDGITGSLFANLSQTIFDGGRLRSQVRSQQAAAEGSLAAYRQSVLTALEDVENGLAALERARERQEAFRVALDAARNQAILARSQYRAGLSDFQTLLEAERNLLSARDGLINAEADETLAAVQIYRALGGGWDPAPTPGVTA